MKEIYSQPEEREQTRESQTPAEAEQRSSSEGGQYPRGRRMRTEPRRLRAPWSVLENCHQEGRTVGPKGRCASVRNMCCARVSLSARSKKQEAKGSNSWTVESSMEIALNKYLHYCCGENARTFKSLTCQRWSMGIVVYIQTEKERQEFREKCGK